MIIPLSTDEDASIFVPENLSTVPEPADLALGPSP